MWFAGAFTLIRWISKFDKKTCIIGVAKVWITTNMWFPCYHHLMHNVHAQSCLVLGNCGDIQVCRDRLSTTVVLSYCNLPQRLLAHAPLSTRSITVGMLSGSRTIRVYDLVRWFGVVRCGQELKKYNGMFNHPRPRCQDCEVRLFFGHGAKYSPLQEYHDTSAKGSIRQSIVHTFFPIPWNNRRP
jgi:hypothetical protein